MQATAQASGKYKPKCPWKKFAEDWTPYIDEEYLPQGTRLNDPSRLNESDVSPIVTHWHERAANGKSDIFRFKAYPSGANILDAKYDPPNIESNSDGNKSKKSRGTRKAHSKRIPRRSRKQDPKGKGKGKAVVDDEDSGESEEGEYIDTELNNDEEDDESDDDSAETYQKEVSGGEVLPEVKIPSAVKRNRESRAHFLSELTTSIDFITVVSYYEKIKV